MKVEDGLGNEITDSSHIGLINPFRYRSYYYDQETKLYYLNSRYYNPEWCRFISPDSLIGINQDVFANNLYLYVSNNPINNIDQDGQFIISAINLGKKLGKSLKKGIKKLAKEVKKVVNLQLTNTKNDAKNIKNVINGIIAFDYSIESGEIATQNIYGNEGAPLTVEAEPTSKLYDSTYSFKITTSLGTLSMINGIGTKAYRYETPLNNRKQRYIIERGSNIYSQYTLNGYETERDYGITTFVYNRFTVSKLAIALVMISPELSAVEYKLNRAISFINNLARAVSCA